MNWLPLGLAAAVLHGAISVTDKVVLERYLRGSWAYPFFTALFLGLYCLVILTGRLALGVFHPPSLQAALLALLPGLLQYAAGLVMVQALMRADASTVAGISQVSPIFSVAWGILFLGDRYTPLNYAGIILLVLCAVLLAWEKPAASALEVGPFPGPERRRGGRLNRALWLVLFGALLRSLADLFTKIAVTGLAFWDAFSLNRLGMLLPALLLFANPAVRCAVMGPVRQHGARVVGLSGFIEFCVLLNLMLNIAAFDRGPLALVSATQAMVPLIVLALTGLANRLRPGLVPVKEDGLSAGARLALGGGMISAVFLLTYRS